MRPGGMTIVKQQGMEVLGVDLSPSKPTESAITFTAPSIDSEYTVVIRERELHTWNLM
jgi:hypothetical protein